MSVNNLGCQLPTGSWLYRGLSMEFSAGTWTAVIGPNGAGKSTLLRQLAGLQPQTTGTTNLDGRSLLETPAHQRARRLGYLPQRCELYHELRVLDVVSLGRAPYSKRFSPLTLDDRQKVQHALERVGLSDMSLRRTSTLSGGELQRVMLARILAAESPFLLLDEPTTSLDIGHALEFLELCKTLTHGHAAVIVAMHELDLAKRYADTVICPKERTQRRVCPGPPGVGHCPASYRSCVQRTATMH
ncbi:MAG: ABC transporter ATP-binding protein [Myxococcota bacterium]